MIDFTPITRLAAIRHLKALQRGIDNPEETQRSVLTSLLKKGSRTEWGRKHGITGKESYEEYASRVPVQGYEDFRDDVMRMVNGEKDVLWPGHTRRFAQSSGTSGGKSKYIPITMDSLHRNHYAGAQSSVYLYLYRHPESHIFSGKGLILGGSFANELASGTKAKVGDLSATLIDDINPVVNLFRVPNKTIALMTDWQKKLPALIDASYDQNITSISGVPSWFLTVLKGVLAKARAEGRQAATIQDIWPNLEVFFHGGIAFGPYRDEYAQIMSPQMHYWETYNASEGFFACQSAVGDATLLLLLNAGVFYEFIPLDQVDSPHPHACPAWAVEAGKTYAMVISSCNGLWRYQIGDTVKVHSTHPLKITIAGRTQSFINAFGEELMVCNADAAIAKACQQTGCTIANYTAAPVYTHDKTKGHHQWMIEWGTKPADIDEFATLLDRLLQEENSDYQAKRNGDIFLAQLELVTARPGLFDQWLGSTGKLGGQRKVPRLCNDRKIMDRLIDMNQPID